MKVRKEVELFAQAMERKLKKNDYKGGWEDCNPNESFKESIIRGIDRTKKHNEKYVLKEGKVIKMCDMFIHGGKSKICHQ